MNTMILVEKLKSKATETNEIVENVKIKQENILNSAKDFNFLLKDYIESDIQEKNLLADAQERMNIIKIRIENSKLSINSIKEKIKNIKYKLNL